MDNTAKRPYQAPKMTVFGKIEQLTEATPVS